jgi:hypothetical protein
MRVGNAAAGGSAALNSRLSIIFYTDPCLEMCPYAAAIIALVEQAAPNDG